MCTVHVRVSSYVYAHTHMCTAMQRATQKVLFVCVCVKFIFGPANCVVKMPNFCVRAIVGFCCAHGRLNGAPNFDFERCLYA